MLTAYSQRKNWLPTLCLVLAIACLSYVSIPLVFKGSKNELSRLQDKPIEALQSIALTDKKRQDLLEISSWHLFGQEDVSSNNSSGASTATIPETELELKLQGVFTISEPVNYAHAFIESSDKIQKSYKLNDTLPGGATLKAIENEKIIILRNNRQESLSLVRQKPE
jgi:general secretion pathway protein C